MRISHKISLCFSVIFCIFLGIFAISYMNNLTLSQTLHTIETREIPLIQTADNIHISMLNHRRYEKDILLNIGASEKQRSYLSRLEKENLTLREYVTNIRSFFLQDSEKYAELLHELDTIDTQLSLYMQGVRKVTEAVIKNPSLTPQEGNTMVGQFKKATYAVEESIARILEKNNVFLQTSLKENIHTAQQARMLSLVGIVLGLSICLLAMFITLRAISQPLQRVINYASAIRDGQLHSKAEGTFVAEMHELVYTLESMAQSIQEQMRTAQAQTEAAQTAQEEARKAQKLTEEALQKAEYAKKEGMNDAAAKLQDIAASIEAITQTIQETAKDSEEKTTHQATSMAHTSASMDDMSQNMMEMVHNVNTAASSSDSTRAKAEKGAHVVQQALKSITIVQEETKDLRTGMIALGEHAENITAILGVISDIADQTNLLALNAAIEAARAGESGRGFAVVADEVRKLAEKTMDSTAHVAKAITAIQNSTKQSITQVDNTVHMVAKATNLSLESGSALQEIVLLVDNFANQMQAITEASHKQSMTSSEVTVSVTEVATLAMDTKANMEHTVHAVNQLREQAHALSTVIQSLKNS